MNVRIVAIAALCCVAGMPFGGNAGPQASPALSRELFYGPLLAGPRVVWVERDGNQLVLESGAPGRQAVAVFRQESTHVWLDDLAASAEQVALERRTTVCPPPTPPIAHSCTEKRAVLGGAPSGPFGLLAASDDCGGGAISVWPSVDVSGNLAAIGENVCLSPGHRRRRILVVRPGTSPPSVLCDADLLKGPQRCGGDARIAGRFVAWREGRDAIVVFDRARRRIAYRPVFPFIESFDLQRDGKLVVAYHPRSAAGPAWVAWRSPRSDGRGLPFRIRIPDRRNASIRIAGDQILAERALSGTSSALVLSDLQGRTRRIARFAGQVRRAGDFDLDGTRLTWASTRVTSSHTECPPPGIMRPCVVSEIGVTTIRLASVAGGTPRVVARLPFRDVIR